MAVQARTLEFYNQFGFADEMVNSGVQAKCIHLREKTGRDSSHEILTVSFKDIGEGISPFPFLLTFPQDDHERFLLDKLKAAGSQVEWNARLTGFTEDFDGVQASIQHLTGNSAVSTPEQFAAAYICGCDGAHSCVRETLKVGFQGGEYEQLFYVVDAKIESGFERDFFINLGEQSLALMFPVRSSGMQRILGLVPPELSSKGPRQITFEDIRPHVEPLLNVKVTEVNWFSCYRVHHRVAQNFRAGRAFLLGDAAHIHSPLGGQGMNTGIGDALNLGWKLADVLRGRASESILDSYEQERIGFARSLVATTDRAFTPLVAKGMLGEMTRRVVAPLMLSIASRITLARHELFRTVSQVQIHYSTSPLSRGEAGDTKAGDRLPWTGFHGPDNFAPLRSLDWQVHVYGEVHSDLKAACDHMHLPIHGLLWSDDAKRNGLKRDAFYLVRPDGYVGFASHDQSSIAELQAYIASFGLRWTA